VKGRLFALEAILLFVRSENAGEESLRIACKNRLNARNFHNVIANS
jgi:hypothetical protein